MANYDIGNSTAKNYDTEFELEILKPWIVNVHIKDRNIGGYTMPLGQGDVNFDLFSNFYNSAYKLYKNIRVKEKRDILLQLNNIYNKEILTKNLKRTIFF